MSRKLRSRTKEKCACCEKRVTLQLGWNAVEYSAKSLLGLTPSAAPGEYPPSNLAHCGFRCWSKGREKCRPVPAITVTCVSKTADVQLRGISAYVDANAGPVYKWRKRVLSGYYCRRFGIRPEGGYYDLRSVAYSGEYIPGVSSAQGGYFYSACHGCACHAATPSVYLELSEQYDRDSSAPTSCGSDNLQREIKTQTIMRRIGCGEVAAHPGQSDGSNGLSELQEPYTLRDGMDDAESPTIGAECTAVTGGMDLTSEESILPMTAYNVTTVDLHLSINDAAFPSGTWSFQIRIINRIKVGGVFVDAPDSYVTGTISTDGSGVGSAVVSIPQPVSEGDATYAGIELECIREYCDGVTVPGFRTWLMAKSSLSADWAAAPCPGVPSVRLPCLQESSGSPDAYLTSEPPCLPPDSADPLLCPEKRLVYPSGTVTGLDASSGYTLYVVWQKYLINESMAWTATDDAEVSVHVFTTDASGAGSIPSGGPALNLETGPFWTGFRPVSVHIVKEVA